MTYEKLLEIFYKEHSPTNERKPQYQSAVFTYGPEQAEEAKAAREREETNLGRSVHTLIQPAQTFWMAEDYHQQYLDQRGTYACPR